MLKNERHSQVGLLSSHFILFSLHLRHPALDLIFMRDIGYFRGCLKQCSCVILEACEERARFWAAAFDPLGKSIRGNKGW